MRKGKTRKAHMKDQKNKQKKYIDRKIPQVKNCDYNDK